MKKNYIKLFFVLIININSFLFADNIDTTFGQGNGYVTASYANGIQINSISLQQDTKIIACGYTQNPNNQFVIMRYNDDGTPDTNFGTTGITTTQIGSTTSRAEILCSTIQADGKIVVAGYYYDTNILTQIVIARYNTDGALDTNFGTLGTITTLIGTGCSAKSMVIDAAGNIVVTGNAVINGSPQIAIARYTTDGRFDTNFGNNGIVTTAIGVRACANAVSIDSSNNIVIAGCASDGSTSNTFMLAKYSSTGVLDTSFANEGIALTTIGNVSEINSMGIDSNGKIVVCGYSNSGSDVATIARYKNTGTLDTDFNSSGDTPGIITCKYGNRARVNALALDDSDNIIIAGCFNTDKNNYFVSKYIASGNIDNTFGNLGVITGATANGAIANAIAMQIDRKILAAGYEFDSITGQTCGLILRCPSTNTDSISISNILNGSTLQQKTITLAGTSTGNNAHVNLFLDGVAFGSQITTDSSGNWSTTTYSSVLSEGLHTAIAQLLDNSNNVISSNLIKFTVDTSVVSAYSSGQELRVDTIFGNDASGVRNGAPFATISKALSLAQPGDSVRICPGIYNESFVVPNFVSIRGVSAGSCIIAKNVSTSTDLITMGEYSVVEDLTLQLTSSEHVQLRGIVFGGTTTVTSALRGLRIRIDNSTAPSDGSSNVYGIHVIGSGVPQDTVFSAVEVSINVNSIGGGAKRGVLVDSSCGFNMATVIVNVVGAGPGTFIGVETNNVNAVFESLVSIIQGSTADISQTLGTLKIYNVDLDNLNANGLGFVTPSTSGVFAFADSGIVTTGTRYLRIGTATATIAENPFKLSSRVLVKAINVNLLNPPGIGNSVIVTLRKNGVDTASTITLSDNQTFASNNSNSITFAVGDTISVSVNGSLLNTASDIIVTLELY